MKYFIWVNKTTCTETVKGICNDCEYSTVKTKDDSDGRLYE